MAININGYTSSLSLVDYNKYHNANNQDHECNHYDTGSSCYCNDSV